jgi:hypothetical protein
MKINDFVYYYDQNGNTCPTVVEAVRGEKVKIENLEFKKVWVKKANCELQTACI